MRLRVAILAVGVWLAWPGGAVAAGGPVSPVQGEGNGISVAGSSYQYVALASGRSTVVQQLKRTGPVQSSIRLPGQYGIPGVGYNGQTTGLSADGGTLVLADLPGNGTPRTTRLIVIGAPDLTVRERIVLHGWFNVDAISPTGHFLYLIHYPSSDISKYEVRAYDLAHHRLLAAPIVDPHDRDEAMTGFAVTRATSADGRWDYTLYIRPNDVPFIHALDTVALRAVCIDLPSVNQDDLGNATLRLGPGGSVLSIVAQGGTQATVDTATYAVTPVAKDPSVAPIRPAAATHSVQSDGAGDGSVPWAVLALLLVAAAAFAVAAYGARRRARARIT
ncbi:MAG TPA: hypothetical protein VFI54_06955 [Solirubrobacteraceae bacterium]|nr:hypothetical protein [Solirubrobacteraceae bacterium]